MGDAYSFVSCLLRISLSYSSQSGCNGGAVGRANVSKFVVYITIAHVSVKGSMFV